MKKYLVSLICLAWAATASAQDMFWNFDDNQNPLPIPAECDAKFDEIRGGVFMPTMDEMYEYGMAFIKNNALSVKQQGAYCLMGAALQGHADAQLEVAKMYEEGRILPQSDLGAYKWAFISALNGNKDAEKITLMLEQILPTSDLELSKSDIQETRIQIQQNLQKQLEEERRQLEERRAKLEGLNPQAAEEESGEGKTLSDGGPTPESLQEPNSNLKNIFDESDRMQ